MKMELFGPTLFYTGETETETEKSVKMGHPIGQNSSIFTNF